PSKTAT
ncbi:hypothetical protein D046_7363B, partial [Vibrio parahaemolyticus V-223/04]